MARLSEEECKKKIESLLRAKDKGKSGYATADALLEELLEGGLTPGRVIKLAGGRQAVIVDQFATKNKVFKPAGINRFDLKISHEEPGG
jgi:hypothetical protein